MNRRVLGLVAAILLAVVGTVAIVAYVNDAEDRALAGEEVVEVLVVTDEVPAGTPAEDIGDRVRTERITAKVKAEGAVTDVTTLSGKVSSALLVPGEQLVRQRFIEPTAYRARGASVAVPPGLLQTTIGVSPDRAVGGVLTPGTTVAVTMSFDVVMRTAEAGEATPSNKVTHLTLRKVLVTNVQTDDQFDDDDAADDDAVRPGSAPRGQFLVTLALDDVNSERLIFAAEHGTVWLSIEPADAPEGTTKIVGIDNVYIQP